MGLRTAIARVLKSGALVAKSARAESPFSRRRASSSGWLWDSQRDQMMTEKIQEEAPRVALLLQLAGLLPSNASLPSWYVVHRHFVSIVVFAFGPLVHALYLHDSWRPETQRAVHRLPYSSSVWGLYVMLAVYSAAAVGAADPLAWARSAPLLSVAELAELDRVGSACRRRHGSGGRPRRR